ncbi:MAG TPA: tripartite tricarboxylate transporter substrate-binding protein [Beijerinckiaceae bacterium]|nr:tripartite tricarboxylate transporter substrate-binding protein [Beijerinckiaceae bacterium]
MRQNDKAAKRMLAVVLFAGAVFAVKGSAVAADFYAGKNVTIVIGADVGGGYDAAGRLMARFVGKYLPGAPTLVVENMPAGGSIAAANYLFNAAPRDGTFIGLMQRNVLTAPMSSPDVVKYDLAKFHWLGTLSQETGLVIASSSAPVKTTEDLFNKEMIVGGTIGTDTDITGRLLNALIGTKLKIVTGYKGNNDVLLAMDKGEVQGMADESWSNLKVVRKDAIKSGTLDLLLQNALQKSPDLPNVALAMDYARNDLDRKTLELYFGQKIVARPVLTPPGVPREELQLLQAAFDSMAKDPEFLDAANKANLEMDPASGKAVDDVIDLLAHTPPEVERRFAEITGIAK